MASAQQVFATPELLEMILLRLPERDLLLDQRVNKTWRNLTTASPCLQRKLFYTADIQRGGSGNPNYRCNPLFKIFSGKGSSARFSLPFILYLELPKEWDQPGVSWKKMLLTQPPMTEVNMSIWHTTSAIFAQRTIRKSIGVTLGDIEDYVSCEDLKRTLLSKPDMVVFNGLTRSGEGSDMRNHWAPIDTLGSILGR